MWPLKACHFHFTPTDFSNSIRKSKWIQPLSQFLWLKNKAFKSLGSNLPQPHSSFIEENQFRKMLPDSSTFVRCSSADQRKHAQSLEWLGETKEDTFYPRLDFYNVIFPKTETKLVEIKTAVFNPFTVSAVTSQAYVLT